MRLLKIGFIGAGKVGKALGLYFKKHDLAVSGYYSKTAESAREAARLTASQAFSTIEDLSETSDMVFITVPDQTLKKIDAEIAVLLREHRINAKMIWYHASGAHPADYLSEIKEAGCAVGSMHPLQSFGEPAASASRLSKAWFTMEGTKKALDAGKTVLDLTGAKYSLIKAENKPLYHAGACVISNFLVTLLESGIRFFEAAGMPRDDVFTAVEPLIDATLANIRDKGTIDAITGPIVRGDFNTVGVHLQAIANDLPSELDFYTAMALKTATMLKDKRLTPEQTETFQKILEGEPHA